MEQPRNTGYKNTAKEKHIRMHKLACTLLKSGEATSAAAILKKIAHEAPDFPDIQRWIRKADALAASSGKKTSPRPAAIPQRNPRNKGPLYSSRAKRFEPKPGVTLPKRKIRHRHIAYLMLLGFLLFILSSFRNKRTYMLILDVDSGIVKCYQGAFFPYGWVHSRDYNIGLEPGWENNIEDETLRIHLLKGLKIRGVTQLDRTILEIYRTLGRKALAQKTIDKQQEAVYYFSRIENAQFREEINWDMATAYFNLAELFFTREGNSRQAMECLRKAKQYVSSYPGVDELARKIKTDLS